MNKTKKLTTGAMLLAIVGALILIDRQLSYLFDTLITMLSPVVIIIYSTKYEVKDGAILAVSLLILGFLLGSINYYCYLPIGVIVGIGYSIGLKKNLEKNKLLAISMGLFVVGEIIVTFIAMPILGISIANQLTEMQTLYEDVLTKTNMGVDAFDAIGVSLSNLVLVCYVFATLLVGVMEGLIIHILSIFLLLRLKIKNVATANIFNITMKPVAAYICMALSCLLYATKFVDNETIKLVLISLSLIGSSILIYYGYIFAVIYARLRSGGKKSSSLIIIFALIFLAPYSLIFLLIIGFLYGAGPLKNKLARFTPPTPPQE